MLSLIFGLDLISVTHSGGEDLCAGRMRCDRIAQDSFR